MSGQDILKNSGFTGCLSRAGLGIGSTPAELSIAAPNGAGVDYAIDGIAYHLADDATVVMNATALDTQAADTTCLYLVCLNAAGTLTTVKGREVLNTALGVSDTAEWPAVPADVCPIGGFKVKTVAVTFTGTSTNLDAAGITDTYYNFALGLPLAPQVA